MIHSLVELKNQLIQQGRYTDCVQDMMDYLNELPCEVMEYEEQLVRRLVEKITVHDENIVVAFKSGVEIEVGM